MKLSHVWRRLLSGDNTTGRTAFSRKLLPWLFIALVAAFLTHGEQRSAFDRPLPLPAELGIDTGSGAQSTDAAG